MASAKDHRQFNNPIPRRPTHSVVCLLRQAKGSTTDSGEQVSAGCARRRKNATVREETRFRKKNHHICLFAQIGYRHNPTGQLHQPKILQFHRKTNVSKKKKKHTKKEV